MRAASVRCKSLDMSGLKAMEMHGKREDRIGRKRKVRDLPPLTRGGLDLRERYRRHTSGCRKNAGCKKPVLHFIISFPKGLLTDPDGKGRFVRSVTDRQAEMLRQAVDFIDGTHGGNAVFAARLDRDEQGENIVDVFACPRYVKKTKAAETEWISPTRFGRELARKHRTEIDRRMPDRKSDRMLTSPRAVGISLQAEFADWFETRNGFRLDPRVEKADPGPDRVSPERWKHLEAERGRLDGYRKKLVETHERLEAARRDMNARIENAAHVGSQATEAVISGFLSPRDEPGCWNEGPDFEERGGLERVRRSPWIRSRLLKLGSVWSRIRAVWKGRFREYDWHGPEPG